MVLLQEKPQYSPVQWEKETYRFEETEASACSAPDSCNFPIYF